MRRFRDRQDAGRVLALHLKRYANRPDVIVLGLARGGIPVAFEVARALRAPLDVMVVRKLGVPGHEELAMGAIASGGLRILNDQLIAELRIPSSQVEHVTTIERAELERREAEYRDGRPALDVKGRTVIVVDDGLATGSSMQAAVSALRRAQPAAIVVAAPVGSRDTCLAVRAAADDCICALMPEPFYAVGLWYDDFRQTSDDEVRSLLDEAADGQPAGASVV